MQSMDTKTQLDMALKDALRANDDVRKRTVRMAMAAIKQAEVDRQTTLDEAGMAAILQKEIKIRREALEEAQKADRPDLAAAAEAEIAVIQTFLPKAMSAEELRSLTQAIITEVEASSAADMGKVMKALMPRLQGRAPGDQVNQVVRELLQK